MSASDIVPLERPSLGNVAIAILLALIGFYIGASTFANGASSLLEAGLAAAGIGVFGLWTWVAYLEAAVVDKAEGQR
jgi:hypothetical protein